MDIWIDRIFSLLTEIFIDKRVAVAVIATLPIVEARLAIPMGLASGLKWSQAWLFSFLGSSMMIPILLLLFLPLINMVSRIKIFNKSGTFLLDKLGKKAQKVQGKGLSSYLGVFLFSALPLPLTGVWSSSAIAAILKLDFFKATLSIVLGNLVASLLLTLFCVFFKSHISTIILAITLIAVAVVISLIIKIALSSKIKSKKAN